MAEEPGDSSHSLDAQIDGLYALPLAEFTAGRNALAKSLKGAAAAAVKRLEKPTAVPWAVNQLYWRDRPCWNRLMTTGAALRLAVVARLSGAAVDNSSSASAHREALKAATASALDIADARGSRVPLDVLTRMLEALSLLAAPPVQPGRFVDLVQPGGLDALAGLALVPASGPRTPLSFASAASARANTAATERAQHRARMAAARAQVEAEVRQSAAALKDALASEQRARALLSLVQQQFDSAMRAVREAESMVGRARAASDAATRALQALPMPDRDR